MDDAKSCFVIAPIGDEDSETRKRSDKVLRHIIRPAAKECGYNAIRADEIDKPGIITSQVIQRVVGDSLVIADLTETNPNVFYELAIRHAIRKPLVQIIQKGERIPFDVAGSRTIYFDPTDLDSVDEAKKAIIDQIRSLEVAPSDIETPISLSLDLQVLRQSEDPEERSLAELVAAINTLSSDLGKYNENLPKNFELGVINELIETIDNLPKRVARELARKSSSLGKPKALDPFVLRELTRMVSKRSSGPISILIVLSFYRDQLPWLYELGLEAYRRANSGDWKGARNVIKDLRATAEMALRGPLMEELFENKKEAFILSDELPFLLERIIEESMHVSEV